MIKYILMAFIATGVSTSLAESNDESRMLQGKDHYPGIGGPRCPKIKCGKESVVKESLKDFDASKSTDAGNI